MYTVFFFLSFKGDRLTGENNYIIHFEKGNLPPVKAFWSLTMYGSDHFFVDNIINKYSIKSVDDLLFE